MTVPSTFRKTEVVVVQHVMEESEKSLAPEGVEIRHLQEKIVIRGRPYRESLSAQVSEVSLLHSYRTLSGALDKCTHRNL
jgi:hypothetical protein